MTSQTRRSLAWAQFLAQLCFPTRHLPQASPHPPRALALTHRRAVPACVLGPCSCLAGASRPSLHVFPAPELQNLAQVAAVRIRVRKSLERLSPARAINPGRRAPISQELMTKYFRLLRARVCAELWECSMCLESIMGVVWQCRSGHLLCGVCFSLAFGNRLTATPALAANSRDFSESFCASYESTPHRAPECYNCTLSAGLPRSHPNRKTKLPHVQYCSGRHPQPVIFNARTQRQLRSARIRTHT